jgi:hypothetical protein
VPPHPRLVKIRRAGASSSGIRSTTRSLCAATAQRPSTRRRPGANQRSGGSPCRPSKSSQAASGMSRMGARYGGSMFAMWGSPRRGRCRCSHRARHRGSVLSLETWDIPRNVSRPFELHFPPEVMAGIGPMDALSHAPDGRDYPTTLHRHGYTQTDRFERMESGARRIPNW